MSDSTRMSATSRQLDLFPTSAAFPRSSSDRRPARTSAAPTRRVRGSRANARASTSRPCGWSESAALAGSLLRTALTSELAAPTGCSMSWKRSATPAGHAWWVLRISAPTMSASGPGSSAAIPNSLPTPVSQFQQGGMRMEGGSGARKAMKDSGLSDLFRNRPLPTPMASDGMKDGAGGGAGSTYPLRMIFATPRKSDADRGGRGDVLSQLQGHDSRHAGMLHAPEILPTPTKRDRRMDGWSPAYDRRKSPTMDAVMARAMDGAMTDRAPDKWAGARALAAILRSHGLTGTAALPITYGWMQGFPPGWLARALRSAVDAGRLRPA